MGTRRLIMVGEKLRVPVLATTETAAAATAVTVSVTPAAVPAVPQGNFLAIGGVLLAGAAAVGAAVKIAPRITAARRQKELNAVTEQAEAVATEEAVAVLEAAVEVEEAVEEAAELIPETAHSSSAASAVKPVGAAEAAEMIPVTAQVSRALEPTPLTRGSRMNSGQRLNREFDRGARSECWWESRLVA